ncbi:Zinc metalloproteinase nas-13 [Armadillidium vulgare]|nr:Zinc metalloproteinase nas-13 [Armadillidium vulgare]
MSLHGMCSSSVGRVGGKQTVSLGAGCVYFGIILHELMHAVGFWHEQSRADRNDYVRINWGNIRNGMEYNFQKYDWTIIQNLGVNYDTVFQRFIYYVGGLIEKVEVTNCLRWQVKRLPR